MTYWGTILMLSGLFRLPLMMSKSCRESESLAILGEDLCNRLFYYDPYDTTDIYQYAYEISNCEISYDEISKKFEIKGQKCRRIPLNESLPLGRKLVVRNTDIREINEDDFLTWDVKELEIVLNSELEKIGRRAFETVRGLERLMVYGNTRYRLEAESLMGLNRLKCLELQVRDSEMGEVRRVVKGLPGVKRLDLSGSELKELSGLEGSLRELAVAGCGLSRVSERLLSGLPHLTSLELGHNNLDVDCLEGFLRRARTSRLGYLGLSNNLIDGDASIKLFSLLHDLQSLTCLDLSKNHPFSFSLILFKLNQSGIPQQTVMKDVPSVRTLNLSSIVFSGIPVVNATSFYPKLNNLYLTQNKFSGSFPLSSRSLKVLDLSWNTNLNWDGKFTINPKDFDLLPSLEVLNLTGNSLKDLNEKSFQYAKKLKALFLQQTGLSYLIEKTFSNNRNLLYLDLSRNYFKKTASLSRNVFFGLTTLIALDLSSNQILCLQDDLFEEMKNLTFLSLRGNLIIQVRAVFKPLANLKVIDLSQNMLVRWNQRIFNNSQAVKSIFVDHNQIKHISNEMLEDFENAKIIDLYENPLKCDCALVNAFRHYIDDAGGKLLNTLTKFEKNTKPARCKCDDLSCPSIISYVTIRYFKTDCHDIPPLMVVVVAAMILVPLTIVAFLVYDNYMWELKYVYYMAKVRLFLIRNKSRKIEDEEYKYDAFISYSHEDKWFVSRLIAFLHYEHKLRLCIDEREFMAGELITEAVISRMAKSRTSLLVLSEDYLRSQWCQWELQVAYQRNTFFRKAQPDSLVIVRLTHMDESLLSPNLKFLLKTSFCLQWDPLTCKQKIFWFQLINAIKRSQS